MYYEAKRAIERCGIDVEDLLEKTLEQFNYHALNEFVTPGILKMRYIHHENRRRKKIKMLAEYVRKNRALLSKNQENYNKI